MNRSTQIGILGLILCIGLSGALFYCDQGPKKVTLVLCPKSFSNPYWFAVRDGMNAAAKELQVKAEFLGPAQADIMQQVTLIESLISRRIDGLAVSPNDPDGIKAVIQRARQNGIPVLTFDSDAPTSERLMYIGTDNYRAGREAGQQMLHFLKPPAKVAILTGGLGALNLNERIRGFRDAIRESGVAIEEITLQACDDDNNRALTLMEDISRSRPDLNGWFITGCWPLVSPKSAFTNALAGRTDLIIIGFDTVKEELELVQAGLVHAIIGQRPYDMGYKCVEILYDIVVNRRQPTQSVLDTGVDVITQANVAEFLNKM
ncbi:sugar-binding protein [candidate division KSB1 bacterium]|nr:sugar-binding protein [candidate division KSB1 bacterium]